MPVSASGLYHELLGPAGAPPLILSSGLGGSAKYWEPNLPALTARFRVILYDHRGTGRSDRALQDTFTVEHMADDMIGLLKELGIASAHVIGHAAGGVAGLAMALKAPETVTTLVVVNGWSQPEPHFLRSFETRITLLRDSGLDAFLRAQPIFLYPADWISENMDWLDQEAEHQRKNFPGTETTLQRIAALGAFDISARLGNITCPVLALAAADDMLVPSNASERLAGGLPHGMLARQYRGGHACNVTDPETFNEIVLDWYDSLES
ncbi:MAG: pyrimidine utilization protein D [Hyphomonas sp.]